MSAPPEGADHLFVYGTLRSGLQAHGLLAGRAQLEGMGWMPGRLFDTGSYPAAVPAAEPADRVRGELYRLPAEGGAALLDALDRYEGVVPPEPEEPLFRREEARVACDDGREYRAWVYLFDRSVRWLRRIPSGDYGCQPGGADRA